MTATSPVDESAAATAPADVRPPADQVGVFVSRPVFYLLLLLTLLALAASALLWQRLGNIQEQLARQSADSGTHAIEARTLAREAQELARDTAARLSVTDNRLSEVALQRGQLEELMQSLSRSRDENLVVDIQSSLRLAQQQSQLTLSAEPMLSALQAADQRLARAGQPRLARLRNAVQRDMERIKSASIADVPSLLVRLDELARTVDELPVANEVGTGAAQPRREAHAAAAHWWLRALDAVREEARGLLRVSRIDQPEAALLAPQQAYFVRENLKLKVLNARLSLLARQTELARADLITAGNVLGRYFEQGRRTQLAIATLQQLETQLNKVDIPRIDETLALLDAMAAGR